MEHLRQNSTEYTVALGLAAALAISGCSASEQQNIDRPSPTATAEVTDTASPCDVITKDVAAEALDIPATQLKNRGCANTPDNNNLFRQTWEITSGESKGLQLQVSMIDKAKSGVSSTPAFDTLYQNTDETQRCVLKVEDKETPCVSLPNALAIPASKDKAVLAVLGNTAKPQSFHPETDLNKQIAAETDAHQLLAGMIQEIVPKLGQSIKQSVRPSVVPFPSPSVTTPSKNNEQPNTVSNEVCELYLDQNTCASSNPLVRIGFTSYGDSSKCTFAGEIDWGDGSKTTPYTISGSKERHIPLNSHTYEKPGNYRVSASARTLSGGCSSFNGNYNYTYKEAASCETKLAEHNARAYVYSMLPKGELKRANGTAGLAYDDKESNNVFTDEAGIKWRLLSDFQSKYHQPQGWSYTGSLLSDEAHAPYRKFVSEPDSMGGSYEAVLMPDDVSPNTSYNSLKGRSHTYNNENWLTYGHGMPTYNYADPQKSSVSHLVEDVWPHDSDADYIAPKTESFADAGDSSWRTRRERIERALSHLAKGFTYKEDGGKPALVNADGTTRALEKDIAWYLKEASDCK